MKKITVFIFLGLIIVSSTAFAGQWCHWNGTSGDDCQSDSKGYIVINGMNTRTPSIARNYNYYPLKVVQPDVGPNQIRDSIVWDISDNKIHLTWSVRDMTEEEITEREAEAMPLSEYYLWKVLLLKNVVTAPELADNLPAELKNAYLARKAILGD